MCVFFLCYSPRSPVPYLCFPSRAVNFAMAHCPPAKIAVGSTWLHIRIEHDKPLMSFQYFPVFFLCIRRSREAQWHFLIPFIFSWAYASVLMTRQSNVCQGVTFNIYTSLGQKYCDYPYGFLCSFDLLLCSLLLSCVPCTCSTIFCDTFCSVCGRVLPLFFLFFFTQSGIYSSDP